MFAKVEEPKENKNQLAENTVSQKLGSSKTTFQFADNRPEAIAQKKLQEMANNSPRTMQLKAFQNKANNSVKVQQAAKMQAMADNHNHLIQQRQSIQRKENNTGLPDNLKAGIENISGYSMDDVKVHRNSDKPAMLQAHAYAQGTDIHIAPGQEKHLPHEAWHVVQQKQGRVQPTIQAKSGALISDNASLEKEADLKGVKALAAGENTTRTNGNHSSPQGSGALQLKTVSGSAPIQRMPLDVAVTGITHLVFLNDEGSLYDEDYLSNEGTEVQEGDYVEIETDSALRSRRGPNQEVAENNEADASGPSHYEWYRVIRLNGVPVGEDTYIREDTFRHVDEGDEQNLPIRSTVYGMTDVSQENLQLAYDEGFRDFDAAYMYHEGKTATLFHNLNINAGPVRLIYKFKLGELSEADAELTKLAQMKGVIIHTVMLHEMPLGETNQRAALDILRQFAAKYHAKVGLSNVIEEDIDSQDNFSQVLKVAERMGIRVSSVQNRMSPSAPDERVRDLCAEEGIAYMGFGLKGGGDHGGTCKMNADSSVENYEIHTDPMFIKYATQLGLKPGEFRHVMLNWARQKGVSAISQSSSSEGMGLMRSSFQPELIEFLEIYGHGNEHFPHHPDRAGLYQPFELYLEELSIDMHLMQRLFDEIPMNLWRLFYKHSLALEKENSDFAHVMNDIDAAGVTDLLALNETEGAATSVTDLNNLFRKFRYGMRANALEEADGNVQEEQAQDPYPANLTDDQLAAFHNSVNLDGQTRLLFDPDMVMPVKNVLSMGVGDTVQIMIAADVVATYQKTDDNQWQRQ